MKKLIVIQNVKNETGKTTFGLQIRKMILKENPFDKLFFIDEGTSNIDFDEVLEIDADWYIFITQNANIAISLLEKSNNNIATYNFTGYNYKEKSYTEREICEVLRLGVYRKFPLLAKHKDGCELTVLFTSETQGVPLVSADGKKEMRGVESGWVSCFDSEIWDIIIPSEELIGLMQGLVDGLKRGSIDSTTTVCSLYNKCLGFRKNKIGCFGGEECYVKK